MGGIHFLSKMSIFTILKKFFTILILSLGVNFTASAQLKSAAEINDAPARIVKFFPNPATTSINFELPIGYDKLYTIQLYNFMGRKISEAPASGQRISFKLDGLYRGVYIFQLRNKSGKIIESGKFQVVPY